MARIGWGPDLSTYPLVQEVTQKRAEESSGKLTAVPRNLVKAQLSALFFVMAMFLEGGVLPVLTGWS